MTRNRRREKEFYEMLNSCQGVILSICCSFAGRGTPDADDLYQEILVNLWVGMHTYRGESDIKTWVHVVALNTARMYRRRQKKERVGNTGLISQMLSDSLAAEPEDDLERERIDIMYRLIDQLDEDEKMITFLFIDRVRVKQIASATGKSVDAVKQAIRRIKNKLRMLYEKEKDNDR